MSGPGGFQEGMGFDPARTETAEKERLFALSKMELPSEAYRIAGNSYNAKTDNFKYMFPHHLPIRPDYNKTGKAIEIRVNQFKVQQWPQKTVHQYDIMIGSGAEQRSLIKIVWNCKTLQDKLKALDPCWLFDGNKIAWCSTKAPRELRILIDLDAEKGQAPRAGRDNTCRVIIRCAKEIKLAVISGYLDKTIPFDSTVLEAITFFDHLMRQWPSELYVQIKRSFFTKMGPRFPLDNCIEAMKGVYSSMRLCQQVGSFGTSTGLAVNVDVANGTFWTGQSLAQAARNYCNSHNRSLEWTVFRDLLMPVKDKSGNWNMSFDFKELRKLTKMRFSVKHRGKQIESTYIIKRFIFEQKYGQHGATAKAVKFPYRDRSKPDDPPVEISIYDYFRKQYNITLTHWYLPCIETTRNGIFPMEICNVVLNQQYKFKMSPDQTAKMIKFAVTRPKERLSAIQAGIGMLKWSGDPYLNHFGVKIDTNLTLSKARLLPNPEIQYSGAKLNPGTTGRWDLRGKKFLAGNPTPLESWGVCIVEQCIDQPTLQNFLKVFIQTYMGHGGRVNNKNPAIHVHSRGSDLGEAVVATRTAAGNQAKKEPQILLFILGDKNSITYERLKKSMDCRFGIVSQMMNKIHVQKAQPQYCSNVCMKLNAKLGGTTSRVAGKDAKTPAPFFTEPTMIIGADVSHPSPGSPQASMAAMTFSMDKEACRYAAQVQTNGIRIEMITPTNIKSMLIPMMKHWVATVGSSKTGPTHIYYFRDGVSEGQYIHVLEQEVATMKAVIKETFRVDIKFTVIVCSKRHHVRLFPKDGDNMAGDKNGNPLPGTLVERDVTHPFEYDFYLNSHSAIQGTARPVHYHVLLDEAKIDPNKLHAMIYQHCYQYMRSTTPVSLYPAVYYAHLASNRARAHEDIASSAGARGGQKFTEMHNKLLAAGKLPTETSDSRRPTEVKPLVALGAMAQDVKQRALINASMWYI